MPCIEAAGGDAQHSTHRGNGIDGPIRPHELESLSGTVPVSRANQAAAFLDLALQLERPVLATQMAQLISLLRRQTIRATARIQVGLLDPRPNRLLRWLKLPGQLAELSTRPIQFHDLLPVLRWI